MTEINNLNIEAIWKRIKSFVSIHTLQEVSEKAYQYKKMSFLIFLI